MKTFVKKLIPKGLLLYYKDKKNETNGRKNARQRVGNTVLCPCCGKTFDRFIDFNITEDNNYDRFKDTYKRKICPYCFAAPRHRIICYYLDKNNQMSNGDIIMFGAEYSIRKWFDKKGYQYTMADLFDPTADVKVDIQNTPFPNEKWGLIVCNHVLEHVNDYKKALKELKRILKKDGILELTVPTDRSFETCYEDPCIVNKEERIRVFGQGDHMRIFGNDFEKTLTDLGFLVEVIDGNTLPESIVGVIGPADYDDNRVYICRKQS